MVKDLTGPGVSIDFWVCCLMIAQSVEVRVPLVDEAIADPILRYVEIRGDLNFGALFEARESRFEIKSDSSIPVPNDLSIGILFFKVQARTLANSRQFWLSEIFMRPRLNPAFLKIVFQKKAESGRAFEPAADQRNYHNLLDLHVIFSLDDFSIMPIYLRGTLNVWEYNQHAITDGLDGLSLPYP